jgi:hypothetical protein
LAGIIIKSPNIPVNRKREESLEWCQELQENGFSHLLVWCNCSA